MRTFSSIVLISQEVVNSIRRKGRRKTKSTGNFHEIIQLPQDTSLNFSYWRKSTEDVLYKIHFSACTDVESKAHLKQISTVKFTVPLFKGVCININLVQNAVYLQVTVHNKFYHRETWGNRMKGLRQVWNYKDNTFRCYCALSFERI